MNVERSLMPKMLFSRLGFEVFLYKVEGIDEDAWNKKGDQEPVTIVVDGHEKGQFGEKVQDIFSEANGAWRVTFPKKVIMEVLGGSPDEFIGI